MGRAFCAEGGGGSPRRRGGNQRGSRRRGRGGASFRPGHSFAALTTMQASAGEPQQQSSVAEAVASQTVAVLTRDTRGRPTMEAEINGKGPFRMVVDTAAQTSLVTPTLVDELGLPAIGEMGIGGVAGQQQARIYGVDWFKTSLFDITDVGMLALPNATVTEAPGHCRHGDVHPESRRLRQCRQRSSGSARRNRWSYIQGPGRYGRVRGVGRSLERARLDGEQPATCPRRSHPRRDPTRNDRPKRHGRPHPIGTCQFSGRAPDLHRSESVTAGAEGGPSLIVGADLLNNLDA